MKKRICIAILMAVGIVTGMLLFFERRDTKTTDVFERSLVQLEKANDNLFYAYQDKISFDL